MKQPIVICGATGNIGSRIAGILLAAGEPVRVVGRERVRLGPLASKGDEEPWPGHIGDTTFLEKAFSGARGAFVLIPPGYDAPHDPGYQDHVGASRVSALSKARVPRVVALSSVGAHLDNGTGPTPRACTAWATRLRQLRHAEVACLRPGYFMENHLWSIPLIRGRGINGGTVRPDVPIPMVATEDIAKTAARLFLEGKFTGSGIRYLLGPRDLTLDEATRILGEAIGMPGLKYIHFPEEEGLAVRWPGQGCRKAPSRRCWRWSAASTREGSAPRGKGTLRARRRRPWRIS